MGWGTVLGSLLKVGVILIANRYDPDKAFHRAISQLSYDWRDNADEGVTHIVNENADAFADDLARLERRRLREYIIKHSDPKSSDVS